MPEPRCFDELSDTALDDLPYGVVRLGPDGVVERYNQAEARRAGVQRWRALGRNFFRDLAGVDADELAAHVRSLRRGQRVRVMHTFRRYRGSDPAVIDMARSDEDRVYLCIRSSRSA